MKKVIRLTESDLMRIVKRVINEEKDKNMNISEVSGGKLNEFFGADGSVNVKIEGDGPIREVVLDILRKSLRGLSGDVNLYFGDEKVHLGRSRH